MNLLISSLVTMCANLILFGLIPFVWWLIFWRKEENFFHWLGFYKPKLQVKWWIAILFFASYIFFYEFDFTIFIDQETIDYLSTNASAGSNQYAGIGIAAIIPMIFVNLIGNGIAEEVLFRGFFCKRLCAKFGTIKGSVIQAILFGSMHNILLLLAGMQVSLRYHIFVLIFGAAAALLLGLANEKIFNKSIWPSVILHGVGNALGTLTNAFS